MASLTAVPMVTFVNVLDQYSIDKDLKCQFIFDRKYDYELNDCVCIYKLGWNHYTEWICCQPVSHLSGKICSVTIPSHQLPHDVFELCQFCYIRGDKLQGASTPFELVKGPNPAPTFSNFNSIDDLTNWQIYAEKDDKIRQLKVENNVLKKENSVLKESLKVLLGSCNSGNCTENLKKLCLDKDIVTKLNNMVLEHDKDIEMLKAKVAKGSEEYKKLYSEKQNVEKKYEKLKDFYKGPSAQTEQQSFSELNLDAIGDLESIPPFPSLFKP